QPAQRGRRRPLLHLHRRRPRAAGHPHHPAPGRRVAPRPALDPRAALAGRGHQTTAAPGRRENRAGRRPGSTRAMKPDAPPPPPPAFHPPVSTLGGPIAELIAQQMLAPPARPGLLGTLHQFEIQRVLGSGGMGVVLLARDSAAGRSVAIKLIRPEWVADQRILHRFVKEAGHLQKLKHPNVVPVLEVSDRAAGPYFVMPYYERGSLAAH